MEHFEHTDDVKQKSVYLLHLDTARIVLIGAVVVGVIIASFLFGMNYIKKDTKNDTSLMGNSLSMQFNDKSNDMLDNKLTGSDNDVLKPGDEKLLKEKDNSKDILTDLKDDDANNSKDMLTKEKIQDIIPTDHNIHKSKKKYKKRKKIKKSKYAYKKKNHKKRYKSKRKKRIRKSSRVVEVSHKKRKSYRKKRYYGPRYSIQVASYDKRYKARKEVRKLKKMDYDAHVNRKVVDGKRFYRVRIGPISSKRRALRLLNTVQGVRRYQNSYMVKE